MINRENYEIFFMDYLDGQLSPKQLEALKVFLNDNPDLKEELEDLSGFKLEAKEQSFPDKATLKKTPDLPEINLGNIDAFLLHELEGNLSDEETEKLDTFLKLHPELLSERDKWAQTKLKADESVKMDKSPLITFNGEDFNTACVAYLEGDLSKEDKVLFETLIEENASAFAVFTSYQKSTLQAPDVVFEDKASLKQSEGRVIPIWWRNAAAVAAVFLIGWLMLPNMFGSNNKARTKQTASPTEEINSDKQDIALIENSDSVKSPAPIEPKVNLVAHELVEPDQEDVVAPQKQNNKKQTPKKHQPIDPINIDQGSTLAETEIKVKHVPLKPELRPLDSLIHAPIELKLKLEPEEDNIALNENPVPPVSNNALSVKEAVAKSISNRVTEAPSEYDTDLNYAALNTLGKITNNEVNYEKNKDSDRAVTSFSVGKFGFYRSKRKK